MASNGLGGQPPDSPERQSSFVGLPPIRRTSTFGLLGKKPLGDDKDDVDSIASDTDAPHVPGVPQSVAHQAPGRQPPSSYGVSGQGLGQTQPPPPPPPQQQQQQQQQQSMQQGLPQPFMNDPRPGGPQEGPNATPNGYMAGHGFPGAGGPQASQAFGLGRGGPGGSGPQFGPGPPGMLGPQFPPQAGGNPVQTFPMGGRWKLEESQLSEPLHQPNRKRSSPQLPQPSHFAYDKETEPLPVGSNNSGMPQRRNNSGMPPISAQRYPTLFQEAGQPAPGQSGAQAQPGQLISQGQQQQHLSDPHKTSLSRTSTNEVPEVERGHGRNLSSGLLSKFSRARAGSVSDDKSSIHVVHADSASILSTETDDTKEKKGFFSNLTRRSTAALDQQTPQQQSDMPPPERRQTLHNGGGQNQSQAKPKSSLNLVRTVTDESTPVTGPLASGKKRLSGLVDRLKGPKDDEQPIRPGPPHAGSGPQQRSGFQLAADGHFSMQDRLPLGQQAPPGARLPQGFQPPQGPPGLHGQRAQGPQGQPGQQFAPGQAPHQNFQGLRGPPGALIQGPPQGFPPGQLPQGLHQRHFSGSGPMPPQAPGPQPGQFVGSQQPVLQGQSQALQQKPSFGNLRGQAPNPQQAQSQEPLHQQGPPLSVQHKPHHAGPQQNQPESLQLGKFQNDQQGRPQSPADNQSQGLLPGSPQNAPNAQRMGPPPLGQQQQIQPGGPVNAPGLAGPQFAHQYLGQQGPSGQQLRPGQQVTQQVQGQGPFGSQQPPGSLGQPGQSGPPGPAGAPGGLSRPSIGGPGSASVQATADTFQAAPPRKASGLFGGFLNKLKGTDSESQTSQPNGYQGQGPPQVPGQPVQPPSGQIQQRPSSGPGALNLEGGMGRGQLPIPPDQLQPGMRRTSQSSLGLPIQGGSPGPQPGQQLGQRPTLPSQQPTQSTVRPSGDFNRQNPLGSNPVTPAAVQQQDPLVSANSQNPTPASSRRSQDCLSVVGPGGTPARKAVGSGSSGPDRTSVVSAHSGSTVTQPNSAVSRPDRLHRDDSSDSGLQGRPFRNNSSPAPSIPQYASPDAVGLGRQPSLPTPSHTPAPQPPSPSAPSAPSHAPSQVSPRPSVAETASTSGTDQQGPRPAIPPTQPDVGLQDGNANQGFQQPQMQRFGPPGQQQTFVGQTPRPSGSPVSSQQEVSGTISKLFGKKNQTPAQQASQGPLQEERKKTASKLLGAFRRGSKQPEQFMDPQTQQQTPNGPPGQGRVQLPPHMQAQMQVQMQAQTQAQTQGGRGQLPPHMQAGRGQIRLGQIQGPPQMTGGRGQPSPQMQAGRVGMPPQGPLQGYPQMQAGWGQPQQPQPQQWTATQQRSQSFAPGEQQYAPVPIPRGYETVHGYGQPSMMAPTAYNVGRQYSSPSSQQWNPQYGPPPPQASPAFGQMGPPPMALQDPLLKQQRPIPPNNLPQQQSPPGAATAPIQSQQTHLPQNGQYTPHVQNLQVPVSSQGLRGHPQQPNFQGASPTLSRNPNTPSNVSSQFDESPTISPQVAVPVAGTISPPATSTASPTVEPSYNVSPPAQEDLDHNQLRPMDTNHMDSASRNVVSPPLPVVTPPDVSYEGTHSSGPNLPLDPRRLSDIRLMSSMTNDASERARSASSSSDHHNQGAPQKSGYSSLLAAHAADVSPAQQKQQRSVSEQHGVDHQHSNPNMNINVVQANGHRQDSDDYYDATPRMKSQTVNQSQPSQQQHEYRPEEPRTKPDTIVAAAASAGVGGMLGAAATISEEELTPNHSGTNAQAQGQSGAGAPEAEEKIVVEEAYELPAVNDNSEDLLIMSATSYPGQEWNPYGAGEFGDYD